VLFAGALGGPVGLAVGGLGTLGIGALGLKLLIDSGFFAGGTHSTTGPTGLCTECDGLGGGTTSSWSSFFDTKGRDSGGYRRTPGTDPSYRKEKFKKTGEPAEERRLGSRFVLVQLSAGPFSQYLQREQSA
jgi:hypothetical protein